MNFNFGEVLTRAWQIIWKHKILWIFGLLASCGQSSGNFNSNSSSGGGDGGGFGQSPDLPPQFFRWMQIIEENLTTILIVFIALTCIIVIVATFLGVIGRVGLIRGTAQAESGAEKLIFGELFSGSAPYFWRVFGLSLILAVPAIVIAIVFAAVVVGAAFSAESGSDAGLVGLLATAPLLIGCICLLIPVMFVLRMIFRQAERALVIEELAVMPAISRGWEVFKKNLAALIIMAIILGVIGLVVDIVIAVPIFLIVFPAVIAFALSEGQNITPLILMGICFCLFIPVAWLVQGVVTSYTESAWTLTYLRLTKPQDAAPAVVEANA
jgi:hypothetical protein